MREPTGRGSSAVIQPLPMRSPPSGTVAASVSIGQDIDDHVGRRAAGRLGEHIGHALQVLVVDHLVAREPCPIAQFGQRDELPGAALDLDAAPDRRRSCADRRADAVRSAADCAPCRCAPGPPCRRRAALAACAAICSVVMPFRAAFSLSVTKMIFCCGASRTWSTSTTPGSTASRARTVSAASQQVLVADGPAGRRPRPPRWRSPAVPAAFPPVSSARRAGRQSPAVRCASAGRWRGFAAGGSSCPPD